MKIHIATDHAGFELKQFIIKKLESMNHIVIDHGAFEYDLNDDYPKFCFECGNAVVNDNLKNDGTKQYVSLGIVIGGSGNGEQISANKVKGIRSALCWNNETAKLARTHNNANIIAIGARMHSKNQAYEIIKTFIDSKWPEPQRHANRIKQISEYERNKEIK